MARVEVEGVSKSYDGTRAVQEATFRLAGGEIVALLGPNGAGKTTLIRMIMGILEPDSGRVVLETGVEPPRDGVGYLPEERGLYRRQRVLEVLEYFGRLKGLASGEARERARRYLTRLDLADVETKKIEALSKGMQQKVQLIATLLHDPAVLILDEPMSGLDPVNARLVKDVILEERTRGRAVLLSTHQMAHAEALADRIVMIHHGRIVLDGRRVDIQRQFADGSVLLDRETDVHDLEAVAGVDPAGDHVRVRLKPGAEPRDLLAELLARGRVCQHFERAVTPLEEIFIQVVERTR